MTLSVYTYAKNALFFDFHLIDMLRHHLPLADEIVVSEGFSSDRTYEAIRHLDPKIAVHRTNIGRSDAKTWLEKAKNYARERCSGDWCLLLDCDEFIPEWEFDRLRTFITSTDCHLAAAEYKHFYGNYKVHYENPGRPFPPKRKTILHRNLPSIRVYGDGSDVKMYGVDSDSAPEDSMMVFECHHFGEVRKASRLRHKWRLQASRDLRGRWDWVPGFVFDFFPHRWLDPDVMPFLRLYEGPYIQAVRKNPTEFVRDGFVSYDALRNAAVDGGRTVSGPDEGE